MNALTPIVERTRRQVNERRAQTPLRALEWAAEHRAVDDVPRPLADALGRPGLSVIAEHKRSSPSAGLIADGTELEDVVAAYERAGAAALSVLTEQDSFGGSLTDLRRARVASTLPILRKDFIVDPYQVIESLAAGADAILLIVAAVSPGELADLHRRSCELGLGVLMEVHNHAELEIAAGIGPAVIGINNRDLTTLGVDPEVTFELQARIPAGTLTVSESGWSTPQELDRLRRAGIDAVLIGDALMRSPDIESACRALTSLSR